MFRKILLASAAAVALLSPLAATKSDAHEGRYERHYEHCYKVYYRARCDGPWCFGGECRDYRAAERAAESYHCRGLEVSIR